MLEKIIIIITAFFIIYELYKVMYTDRFLSIYKDALQMLDKITEDQRQISISIQIFKPVHFLLVFIEIAYIVYLALLIISRFFMIGIPLLVIFPIIKNKLKKKGISHSLIVPVDAFVSTLLLLSILFMY